MSQVAGVRRGLLVFTAVIGLGLAVAPLAFNMFSRAPKGAVMLAEFKPLMTSQRLDGFQSYMKQIDSATHEIDAQHPKANGPSYAEFNRQWPQIDKTMTTLLDKVQGNLGNYQDMAAMPSFRLFPWFFVIPGVLALVFALLALTGGLSLLVSRVALGVVGLALVAMPFAFQLFTRAPHGAQMMSTFKNIETTQNVGRIQNYFSTMAVGQGAIRNQIVPALHHGGLSAQQIATKYPATTALDGNWIHILNDMTPMIAAMSDSVPRYDAIRSLPSFTLFPWFFLAPGLLIAGAAVGARRRADAVAAAPVPIPETVQS
jgi:hypothetical protein